MQKTKKQKILYSIAAIFVGLTAVEIYASHQAKQTALDSYRAANCSSYTNWKGEKAYTCPTVDPDLEYNPEDHARLQALNSQRAFEKSWDRAYVETRKAQCEAGSIHRQFC
jgi:hypothetical protein